MPMELNVHEERNRQEFRDKIASLAIKHLRAEDEWLGAAGCGDLEYQAHIKYLEIDAELRRITREYLSFAWWEKSGV